MRTVFWEDDQLKMIDQRRLPGSLEVVAYSTEEQVAQAIRDMVVRGAPAIGAAAAFGLALAAGRSAALPAQFARLEAAASVSKRPSDRRQPGLGIGPVHGCVKAVGRTCVRKRASRGAAPRR